MYLNTLRIAGRCVSLGELAREPIRDEKVAALFEALRARERK